MGGNAAATGPDFTSGVKLSDIPETGFLAGRVGEDSVLLSRIDGQLYAVSGTCTHYGGHLPDGLATGETVRCPLHHACFSLRTGEVLRAPALDPLDRWKVEVEGDRAFVRAKLPAEGQLASPNGDIANVVIVGGGAAGLACALELRKLGYAGNITMLSADGDPPCDRPNLSKDYLAGTAAEEWIPLRTGDWYRDNNIDLRLGVEVTAIDADGRTVQCASGERLIFDRLLLATGAEPNRLNSPGFDRDNVFTLRSLADARAIVGQAREGARAAIIGSSFIGLEAAASLRNRKVEVDVISPEHVPFQRTFGAELGDFLKGLHEENGVRFHLGKGAASFDGQAVHLSDGGQIPADFVLVGVGVRPRLGLAQAAGLNVTDGVVVDAFLQTSAHGIYAAGDIAAYPDPITGEQARIEHWAVAERQGQVAAANMLGLQRKFDSAPFFWTEQYGLTVRYVGHASQPQEVSVEGDLARRDAILRYSEDGQERAAASVNRDHENLEEELRLETNASD
jgi:NADPH-dependent 2,4-dienoyl-CoA reductase/sulfur reductase-like enzyme/nitrite reductase/ring-hydroxylating ferredoxin subunit